MYLQGGREVHKYGFKYEEIRQFHNVQFPVLHELPGSSFWWCHRPSQGECYQEHVRVLARREARGRPLRPIMELGGVGARVGVCGVWGGIEGWLSAGSAMLTVKLIEK